MSNMWYSSLPQLTYNRIFNFAVGVRGGGKTLNTIEEALEKFLKDGSQFIYLRRRGVDLDDACNGKEGEGDLFADIRVLTQKGVFPKLEGHDFTISADKSGGYNFYCDGKIMGYGKALSTARRSTSKPKVTRIIFDEFLIDDSAGSRDRYLNKGDEMFLFNNFYETVARGRDIPCIFIGNAFSMVNPYFIALDIRIDNPIDNKIYSGKVWTVQFVRKEAFIESRKNTQFYLATTGTKFSEHAFGNSFYLDRTDFIRKRSKDSEHQFSMEYMGNKYGVWVDWDAGNYYVSKKGANTSRQKTISMTLADNKPNNVNIRRYRNLPFMKAFRMAADNNSVYYDSQEAFNSMSEVIYLLKTIV